MRAPALLACLAVLALAGCGGDEERRATSTETTNTIESAPETVTQPPARTVTTPPRTITVPAPRRQRTTEDRPGHDTPPPPGSPEERFEKRCKKDPEACG